MTDRLDLQINMHNKAHNLIQIISKFEENEFPNSPFVDMVKFYKKLAALDLSNLPTEISKNILEKLASNTNLLEQYVNQKNVKKVELNPSNQISNLKESFLRTFQDLYSFCIPYIAYIESDYIDQRIKDQVDTINETTDHVLKKFNEDFQDRVKQFDHMNTQFQFLNEQVIKLSEKASISRHASHFMDAADSHNIASIKWLVATVIAGALIILFALFGYNLLLYLGVTSQITGISPSEYITKEILPRTTILVVLFYSFVMCSKNYKIHKHNYIINKHRQNAISTFQSFVTAATSKDIQDAILLQTTHCIFSSQSSGYTSNDKDTDMSSKIIEILKSTTPKS